MFRKKESAQFYLSSEITRQKVEVVKPTHLPINFDGNDGIQQQQQRRQLLTPQELPSHVPGEIFGGERAKRRFLFRRCFRTQIQPEHKSIEAEKGITEYASNEWTTTKPMAMKMKQGYAMVGQQYECIRRIRGDNYCALRSVIFQILSMCDLRKSILEQFATRDKAVERLELLTTQFGDLIKNWSFGQNAKLRGRQDGFNTLKDCISKSYLLIGELKNETVRKRRDKVVTELNKRNAGYFETDARLVEFVKFLMFSKASELYDISAQGGDIPNWFLFLTLRDNSGSLRDFFHYHLNLVGDSLGLEQIEMFLLGVSLNVRIKAFRLKSFGEEDFETLYPPNDDTILPDDAPSLPLIAEDDRHYNVVYSLKK